MPGTRYYMALILLVGPCLPLWAAAPIFENRTPVGFAPTDSTTRSSFVAGDTIRVRVDLNQAATTAHPVVGHFHAVEKSDQTGSVDTDGMQVDLAMVDVVPFGVAISGASTAGGPPVIHMAWIEERGLLPGSGAIFSGGATPLYQVMYARSFDGGASFDTPASVSGNLTYFNTGDNTALAYSTLDLEVDSGGNPRVVYAFVPTADHRGNRDIFFAHSEDGGQTWDPGILVVNDQSVGVGEGRNSAFPRLAIDDRDRIFVAYLRGVPGASSDVMLAKIDHKGFKAVPVGASGTAGTGGVRLTPDGDKALGPDLAIGDGDALHLLYFDDSNDRIEHRRMATDTTWIDVSAGGWNQNAAGALVSVFDNESATNAALLGTDAGIYFPTLAVDRKRLPDRVYAVFKLAQAPSTQGVFFNQYDDDGTTGTGITWGTAASIWTTGAAGLFSTAAAKRVELDWSASERVAAVVDDRLESRGDLHIAFTAGGPGPEHDIYYARYNGSSWTLPEKVADDDSDGSGTQDGIAATDVYLASPALAQHPDTRNIFLGFAGGTAQAFPPTPPLPNVNQHAYFKVLGRDISSEDVSVPVGGFQYNLAYAPVNPQSVGTGVTDNPIYVHVADPTDGSGLGAQATSKDGFLAGDWESVALTLSDDDKFFEGLKDEDSASTNEWGDDDDKVGLLVKLNVLGSDSATNLQAITSSTASAGGSGLGARSVRVGSDPAGSFVAVGDFFFMGADIDIVPSNAAPTASITEPDGSGDQANTSFVIRYSLQDADDDLSANLKAALYAFPSGGLKTPQDIRIFGTLIVDQNDLSANNAAGTDDFTEGSNQSYTWDDPPAALASSALFASILRFRSGDYFIYLVADDGKNPPVFAVSPGVVSIRHSPIVQQIDPIVPDTVDTGVRTGPKANPYDLDFRVVDHDSEARVQLFYAAVGGITSVSATGTFPNQRFVLGKSLAGTRGVSITDSTSLSSRAVEFSWDITQPLVPEGSFFLYAVATDSTSVSVGNSPLPLVVKHSPSFVFFEPGKDTQRSIDSGSQPVFAIQWQKGPGDADLNDNATIDLYFTTDDPAVADHSTESGASATSLTSDADTRTIVLGLKEDGDGPSDIFAWDLRNPPNSVPISGRQVWLYAVISDAGGNISVVRGGSLVVTHNPQIVLETRMPRITQGDLLRLEWDDYMVDDGSGTDDAYLRLYASHTAGLNSLQTLEADVGSGNTFIINSSDGTAAGTITALREAITSSAEDTVNAFLWDTSTPSFTLPEGEFSVYAGISADPTFADNAAGRLSEASNRLVVGAGSGAQPHFSLSPNKLQISPGDTLTFEVLVHSNGAPAEVVTAVLDMGNNVFTVLNPTSPFTDLGVVFAGGTVVEDTTVGNQLRFSKSKPGGAIIAPAGAPARLARFSLVLNPGSSGFQNLSFNLDDTMLSLTGNPVPLQKSTGMSAQNAQIGVVARGRIRATVLLEGRAPPLGTGDHSTLLDVHLRLPGSTFDLADAIYRGANDDFATTADTVEVQTDATGALSLVSVPAGRYVLAVKDSSHLSGRTDTLTVRNGETLILTSSRGFFASDIRGDASFLLRQNGRLLEGGDATGDNEIDEDDVNLIDAAWGTDSSKPNFAQADINNDGRVGAEDLAVTTSNISNSTGFGAPPVFKRARGAGAPGLEILAPGHEGPWRRGAEVELVFMARALEALAAYELELEYDPGEMEILPQAQAARVGAVFAPNPQGYFERLERAPGRLAAAAARRGRAWSAAGAGELLRLRVRLLDEGFPASLRLRRAHLVEADYERADIQLLNDPKRLALPGKFSLGQNYPNPFNPSTTIPFSVPALEAPAGGTGRLPVSVRIYNALGQRVRTLADQSMEPGFYRLRWDGRNSAGRALGSGLYFYKVRVGKAARVGKMTLLK